MHTCKRCSQSIPGGRSYCTAHYMEALANYEADLAQYQSDLARWNSLTPGQQRALDEQAEIVSVAMHATSVGLALGAGIWYALSRQVEIDALLGIGILIASVVLVTAVQPVRALAGRLARLLVKSVAYFAALWILGAIIAIWSPFMKAHATGLSSALALFVLVLSVYLEMSGGHHASGRPIAPSKPSP
jgi:hypothetical protein